MQFSVGDIVQMKKDHPCGSNQWEILRTGIDFRIKCCGCGHMVMLPRVKFEKKCEKGHHPRKAGGIKKTAFCLHRRLSFFAENPCFPPYSDTGK